MTLTLFPVRLLLAAFMMLLAWPFALLASLGPAERDPGQPLALWRKVVDVLLKAIMRTMWFVGGFHRVVVKGQQAPPTEAAILTLAPHSSYFDAIPVTMTMSSIVMKAESRDIPIWGTLIKYIRPVFVSRLDQDSRRRTVEEIKRRAQSGGRWPQIMIFPEGTCTNRTCLITFKPGAFIPGVPVQPVVLRYPNQLVSTCPGPVSGELEILWLTLCQFHNRVEIEFLPVYSPSEEEKEDPALYASNVRRGWAEGHPRSLDSPGIGTEGPRESKGPGTLAVPVEHVPYVSRPALNPSSPGGRGRMATEGISVPQSGAGEMDPREYVVALSVVCRPAQTLDTMQLAFKMYGSREDGSVDEDALSTILKTAAGVAQLPAARLFRAVDREDRGRITFGEWPRQGRWPAVWGASPGGWGPRTWSSCHLCAPGHPVSRAALRVRGRTFWLGGA
ncbi:lysophosphatidylcholine acyltransferase 1, partial [Pteropus vampyrus]|uniref:Lysophosphatidylcholine acyltransferase 1 n=1 Tax=Pteropus vampyrus TaxID=132908 RepID=A0A6P6BKB2_PTEVA